LCNQVFTTAAPLSSSIFGTAGSINMRTTSTKRIILSLLPLYNKFAQFLDPLLSPGAAGLVLINIVIGLVPSR
jgi:hypothetical protein